MQRGFWFLVSQDISFHLHFWFSLYFWFLSSILIVLRFRISPRYIKHQTYQASLLESASTLMLTYFSIPGLIYVVDSADSTRFEEAKDELFGIISDEQMSKIPVLILANKQDISLASSPEVIIDKMCLSAIPACQPWTITACSATKGYGIKEGLESFSALVKQSRANQVKSPTKSKKTPSKSWNLCEWLHRTTQ